MSTSDDDTSINDSGSGHNDQFPLKILYCGVCGLPPEYCEFGTPEEFQRCKPWLNEHCPGLYPDLDGSEGLTKQLEQQNLNAEAQKKEKQTQSGNKKKKKEEEILISVAQRKGKKMVTVVSGLDGFGIKLQDASKVCKKKFACGVSVVKAPDQKDVIEIQGDFQQDAAELLRDTYDLNESSIFLIDDKKKRVPAFD